MALSFGSATLTSSWATIGSVLDIPGNWAENRSNGALTVRLKHIKHASQSGGYPMVRIRYQTYNAAGSLVDEYDPVVNPSLTISGGVATVECDSAECKITALTDSAGTPEYPLAILVPPFKGKLFVQAKQAGDTTNFGTLAAELDGRI